MRNTVVNHRDGTGDDADKCACMRREVGVYAMYPLIHSPNYPPVLLTLSVSIPNRQIPSRGPEHTPNIMLHSSTTSAEGIERWGQDVGFCTPEWASMLGLYKD